MEIQLLYGDDVIEIDVACEMGVDLIYKHGFDGELGNL